MKEIFNNDDELKELFSREGLLKPSADFTMRVMNHLEASSKETVIVYKPLISRRIWSILLTSFISVMLLCWWMLSMNPKDNAGYITALKRISEFLNTITLSIRFGSDVLLIVTLSLVSIGTLLYLDFWLSFRRKETVA